MNLNEDFQKRILALLEKQNETMDKIASSIGTLENYSSLDHDQKPFPGHDAEIHEPAWRALYETIVTNVRQKVERWRNGMDSTLIFVALFVTVVTTFQGPVSQNLTANPADTTNELLNNLTTIIYEIAVLNGLKAPVDLPQSEPFERARSDEILTLLWYSSLLSSLISAILAVYGRQWLDHLTEKPEGQTYKVRSMRLSFREALTNKFLRPALESIYPILVLSILLFVAGLLYQLWSIALSGSVKSRILILTSSIGSAFIFVTLIFTLCTFLHGVLCEESPFITATAIAIRRTLPQDLTIGPPMKKLEENLYPFFCSTIIRIAESDHFDQVSSVRFFQRQVNPKTLNQLERIVDAVVFLLGSDASLKAKQTVAWNFTGMWILDEVIKEDTKRISKCHYLLQDALRFAYSNTPSGQEEIRRCFFAAEVAILLTFSGHPFHNPMPCNNPESHILKRLFMKTFVLLPDEFGYSVDLPWTKGVALLECQLLEEEYPALFDNVAKEDPSLLPALLNEDKQGDKDDSWKDFVLKYLDEEDVTKLLSLIASKADGTDDCLNLITLLYRILLSDPEPLDLFLPDDFDLSNVIQFLMAYESRGSSLRLDLLYPNDFDPSPTDICLAYLSLMDGNLLALQKGLSDFLEALLVKHGLESKRPMIHDTMPTVDLITLRCCTVALPIEEDRFELDNTLYETFGAENFFSSEWRV